MKFLLLFVIVYVLYFFLRKKIQHITSDQSLQRPKSYELIKTSPKIIQDVFKRTISNAGLGLILLLVMVMLFAKIKIVLFLLPIALFLITYLALFINHLSKIQQQQIWFNRLTKDVFIEHIKEKDVRFNLDSDVKKVQKIESIQTTKGLLYGYYRVVFERGVLEISYLVADNIPVNDFFIQLLESRCTEKPIKKFFPFL